MQRRLVVKVAGGQSDAERAELGLLVATTAATAGVPVAVWLASECVRLGTADDPGPFSDECVEMLATLRELGTVYACARCAAQRGIGPEDLLQGVRIGGAAQYVEQVLEPDVQALVY